MSASSLQSVHEEVLQAQELLDVLKAANRCDDTDVLKVLGRSVCPDGFRDDLIYAAQRHLKRASCRLHKLEDAERGDGGIAPFEGRSDQADLTG